MLKKMKEVLKRKKEKKIQLREQVDSKVGELNYEELFFLHREDMNKGLLRIAVISIVFIVLFIVAYQLDMVKVSFWYVCFASIFSIVMLLLPVAFAFFHIDGRKISYLSLIGLSVFIFTITTATDFGQQIAFVIPVVASCVFLDEKLTRNIAVIDYILMTITCELKRVEFAIQLRPTDVIQRHDRISDEEFTESSEFLFQKMTDTQLGNIAARTVEYLAVVLLAMMLVKWISILVRRKEEADIANAAKSAFLANMSHEIRTPMNAIMGFSQLILEEEASDDVRMYAQNIRGASTNLLDIINDVLDISKIESGKTELIDDEFEVEKLLRDVLSVISIQAGNKDLALEVHVEENLPKRIYADETRIRQILINILNNAVKYTREGYVAFTASCEQMGSDKVEFSFDVKDSGIGIKEEDIEKLFDEFVQVDMKKNRSVEGTGLGLSIANKLAQMMGGGITISSVYGEGSIFTIKIQAEVVDKTPIGVFDYQKSVAAMLEETEHYSMKEAKILVVDDNRLNLSVCSGLLKKYDIIPDVVQSGEEALAKIREKDYHVVFLDQMMPQMDGIETLGYIREMEKGKELTVIALTANAVNGVKEDLIRMGFDDYLSKPIETEKLLEELIKYLPKELVSVKELEKVANKNQQPAERKRTNPLKDCGIDTAVGVEYCGSRKIYLEILKMYYEEGEETLRQLREDLENEDYKNYTIHVHGLKSTSANIGATDFSLLAREHEMACREERYDYAQQNFKQLEKQYNEILEAIRQFFIERN